MNIANSAQEDGEALTFKGFPYIKVGHFYKMEFKDGRAVAYCASAARFVLMAGSTLAFDCPAANDPDVCTEFESSETRDDMCIHGCLEQKIAGVLDVYNDYGLADPLRAAQAVAGIDAVDAETA